MSIKAAIEWVPFHALNTNWRERCVASISNGYILCWKVNCSSFCINKAIMLHGACLQYPFCACTKQVQAAHVHIFVSHIYSKWHFVTENKTNKQTNVFPPLPLSSPFSRSPNDALQDGLCQTGLSGDMSVPRWPFYSWLQWRGRCWSGTYSLTILMLYYTRWYVYFFCLLHCPATSQSWLTITTRPQNLPFSTCTGKVVPIGSMFQSLLPYWACYK